MKKQKQSKDKTKTKKHLKSYLSACFIENCISVLLKVILELLFSYSKII